MADFHTLTQIRVLSVYRLEHAALLIHIEQTVEQAVSTDRGMDDVGKQRPVVVRKVEDRSRILEIGLVELEIDLVSIGLFNLFPAVGSDERYAAGIKLVAAPSRRERRESERNARPHRHMKLSIVV